MTILDFIFAQELSIGLFRLDGCCPISDHAMILLRIFPFKFSNSRVYMNIVSGGDWLWRPANSKGIGYCLSFSKSRDNDRAHKMASFGSVRMVIWRVLNAKKCSSVILNGFQKFIISKVKCPAITLRFLAVVRAGGRKESASGNCPLHEMPNTRSGAKSGWVRSRQQELLTKISKNRSTVTRCLPVRNISNLRM